jgi:hypothetical protein
MRSIVWLVGAVSLLGQEARKFEEVKKLLYGRAGEQAILYFVEQEKCCSLTADQLVELHKAGASTNILWAIEATAKEANAKPTAKRITNYDILTLVQNRLPEDLVLEFIRNRPCNYLADSNAYLKMRDAGARDDEANHIFEVMMLARKERCSSPGNQPLTRDTVQDSSRTGSPNQPRVPPPSRPGLHYMIRDGWRDAIKETITWKTLAPTLILGRVKTELKGVLEGPGSGNELQARTECIIRIVPPRDLLANDYLLLPVKMINGRRELEVGPADKSGLASRAVSYHLEKLESDTYRFKTPDQAGEFGILRRTDFEKQNQIYTFRISQ